MSQNDNDEIPPNNVFIQADIIDIIFNHLGIVDLFHASKVCKAWRYGAIRERRRRYYIQHFHFLHNSEKLETMLKVNPIITLLIHEEILIPPQIDEEVVYRCRTQLPNYVVGLRVPMRVPQKNGDYEASRFEEISHILGLAFPSVERRLYTHVAVLTDNLWFSHALRREELIDLLTEKLGLNNCQYTQSTLLVFATSLWRSSHTTALVGVIQKALQQEKQIELGFLLGQSILLDYCGVGNSLRDWDCLVFTRISGPTVQSWSTFIHFLARADEIVRKLRQLKDRVEKGKKHYNGLFHVPLCTVLPCEHVDHPCGHKDVVMGYIRRMFPDLQFAGVFTDYEGYRTWVLSTDDQRCNNHFFKNRLDESGTFSADFFDDINSYVSITIISYN